MITNFTKHNSKTAVTVVYQTPCRCSIFGSNHAVTILWKATETYFHVVLFVCFAIQCDFNFFICGSNHAVTILWKATQKNYFHVVLFVCFVIECDFNYFTVDQTKQCDHSLKTTAGTVLSCAVACFKINCVSTFLKRTSSHAMGQLLLFEKLPNSTFTQWCCFPCPSCCPFSR